MARHRHPNKEIEAAVQHAEDLGWRVFEGGSHAHWLLYCPEENRNGCKVPVYLTPREPENHAKQRPAQDRPLPSPRENVLMATTTTTKTYSFALILAGVTEITVDMADALFEAGCDDASPGSCEGIVSVDFDRDAESLGDAVGSAIKDVARAGSPLHASRLNPRRIDVAELLAPHQDGDVAAAELLEPYTRWNDFQAGESLPDLESDSRSYRNGLIYSTDAPSWCGRVGSSRTPGLKRFPPGVMPALHLSEPPVPTDVTDRRKSKNFRPVVLGSVSRAHVCALTI